MGFGIWVEWFRFRVEGWGFGVQVLNLTLGSGFRCLRFCVWGLGFGGLDLGFGVWWFKFGVWGYGIGV